MQLLDNLAKQTTSPTHRSISFGKTLIVKVDGSQSGYLIGAIYSSTNGLLQVAVDGLPGNLKITPENPTGKDLKDGQIELNLFHERISNTILIHSTFEKGKYFLKVEAADNMAAIPQFWNIDFDIV